MKIQFLSGDSITAIKANLNGLRTKFGSGNEWVFNFFDGKSPFKDTKYDIEDFQLDMSQDDPFLTEYFLIQAVQTLAVRDHCDQLQRRIGLLSFQHQLCKILIHAICKATHKTGESICNGSIDLMFQSGFYFVDLILR